MSLFLFQETYLPKPPKPPTKPCTAYIRFSSIKFREVKAIHPDYNVGSIGRIIGQKWKLLTQEEREPFVDMYRKDKVG